MSVKILINSVGQHLIADVKQVTNKETEELVAYWVREPRMIHYKPSEDGQITVDLGSPCPVGVVTEYAIKENCIASILDPIPDILSRYNEIVNPEPQGVVAELESPEEVE